MAPAPSFITGPRRCPFAIKCKPGAAGRKDLTITAHTYNAPTISAGTIARTACLLLALTNQVLSALGKPVLPIESQTVEQLVTAGITTVAALVSWWNNNSFTTAALQADAEFDRLKKQVK